MPNDYKNSLVSFLTRHPWIIGEHLEAVFGEIELKEMLIREETEIQFADVPEMGRCYATMSETEGGLVGVRRIHLARSFVLSVVGPEGLIAGFSPTPLADAECEGHGCWWRIWGDLGYASEESLRFIQHPPGSYGPDVKDIVVVTSEARMETISYQTAKVWGGTNKLFVYVLGTKKYQVVDPGGAGGIQEWEPYSLEDLRIWYSTRQKKDKEFSVSRFDVDGAERMPRPFEHYRGWKEKNKWRTKDCSGEWYREYKNLISSIDKKIIESHASRVQRMVGDEPDSPGATASLLTEDDWRMIVFIGDNPLFNQWELVRVLGTEVYYGPSRMNTYSSEIPTDVDIGNRYRKLRSLELIEELKWKDCAVDLAGRVIPTGKAVRMLVESWGVLPEDFQRLHPWPQTLDRSYRLRYGVNWIRRLYEHQSLCRQFALAVKLGSQSISNGYGRIESSIVTTIGSRFAFIDEHQGGDHLDWISPDAYLQTTVYYKEKVNENSKEIGVAQNDLLVEIDRATNTFTRLGERINKYKKLLPALGHNNPVLVWITLGTEEREGFLIEEMRKAGVEGYTVRLKRLVVNKNDPWWLTHPTARGFVYEYAAIGGMAPFRDVWMCTETGHDLVPLLGKKPWALKIKEHVGRPPDFAKTYRQY